MGLTETIVIRNSNVGPTINKMMITNTMQANKCENSGMYNYKRQLALYIMFQQKVIIIEYKT